MRRLNTGDRVMAVAQSVRFQTTARSLLILVGGLVVAALAFDLILGRQLSANFDRQLQAQAADRATQLDSGGTAEGILTVLGDEEFVAVIEPDGTVQRHSGLARPPELVAPPELVNSPDVGASGPAVADVMVWVTEEDDGELESELEAMRAAFAPTDDRRVVVVGSNGDHAFDPQTNARPYLAAGVLLLTSAGAALVWLNVGRSLSPVDRMRAEVDAMRPDQPGRRLSVGDNGDEITALGETMNRLLARIESFGAAQQRFVADASHELRSPVANLRAMIETTPAAADTDQWQATSAGLVAEVDRLQDLIDNLLFLARGDEQAGPSATEVVDLDDLVFSEIERLTGSTGPTYDASGVTPTQLVANRLQLTRLVRNLLENAGRHATDTVKVKVSVSTRATDQAGNTVWLSVDDDGPGIPAADRERVFERFVRLDSSRQRGSGGSGLGLAIVARIVEWHGGDIELTDSPLGGLQCRVGLPERPAAQPKP